MSTVTKTEIDDCYNQVKGTKLQALNEVQERTFAKICEQATKNVDELDYRVPYLIGEVTNFEFIKMTDFVDYMLSIDPDA